MWADRMKEYRSSSLTAAKWGESKCYKLSGLRYWIHKFNKENASSKSTSKWAAIEVSNLVRYDVNPITVTIGKASIEISSGFDSSTFKKVVLREKFLQGVKMELVVIKEFSKTEFLDKI